MRAAGFVAKRGRRWAVWEKVRNGGEYSLSSLPLHHTDSVTVTPESTMYMSGTGPHSLKQVGAQPNPVKVVDG